MKVGISGCRSFTNYAVFEKKMDIWRLGHLVKIDAIISGGALGVDTLAKLYAENHNIPFTVYEADWKGEHKLKAGLVRNVDIVKACDHLIAFPSTKSIGTKHAIKIAKQEQRRAKRANQKVMGLTVIKI